MNPVKRCTTVAVLNRCTTLAVLNRCTTLVVLNWCTTVAVLNRCTTLASWTDAPQWISWTDAPQWLSWKDAPHWLSWTDAPQWLSWTDAPQWLSCCHLVLSNHLLLLPNVLQDQQWRIDNGQSCCCCARGKEPEHKITKCLTFSSELGSIKSGPKCGVSYKMPFAFKDLYFETNSCWFCVGESSATFRTNNRVCEQLIETRSLRGNRCSVSVSTRHKQTNKQTNKQTQHNPSIESTAIWLLFSRFFVPSRVVKCRHVSSHKQHEVLIQFATHIRPRVRRYQGGFPKNLILRNYTKTCAEKNRNWVKIGQKSCASYWKT